MTAADLGRLTQEVLWASFFLAVAFGALVQRTGFCTMGAISDMVALGESTRMRQWALAAGTAVVVFALFAATGVLRPAQTLYASPRWLWLSALVGGTLFGFGMVLSSGCISKTLVRVGGGNLKSLVVLLVAAVSGFATLKGLTAVWRVATVDRVYVDLGANADLPTLVARAAGTPVAATSLVLGLVVGGVLLAWALLGRERLAPRDLAAGFGVGLLVSALWWVTGHLGHVAEHPQTLEETWIATTTGRAEAFSFVAPAAFALDWLMFFSDTGKRITVGIVSVAGVVLGALAVSLWRRSFRWEGFGGTGDLGHHLAGGVLMGVGGVTAMGCSIGQGVTGLSTLSLTSIVAAAAIVGGGVLGVRYQTWRLERD